MIGRSFQQSWSVNRPWLVYKSKWEYCFCKLCDSKVQLKSTSISDHESILFFISLQNIESKKHQKIISSLNTQKPISSCETAVVIPSDREKKIAELKFATSIAVHSPILASDHMSEIVRLAQCSNSECSNRLKNFSVRRTKCSSLIKNVKIFL